MKPELKAAVETISNECTKYFNNNCEGCQFVWPYGPSGKWVCGCRLCSHETPKEWNPDEWDKEMHHETN